MDRCKVEPKWISNKEDTKVVTVQKPNNSGVTNI